MGCQLKNIAMEVEKIIGELNDLYDSLPNLVTDRQRVKDFDHLENIVNGTLSSVPICSQFIEWDDKDLYPYYFLLKFNIAVNLRRYDCICGSLKGEFLYRWKNNRVSDLDLFILLLWKQNMFTSFSATTLFLKGFTFQTVQLLRTYIESSSILLLALIDYDFLSDLLSSKYSDEEYNKIWFKKLKPSRVTSALKKLKIDLDARRKKHNAFSPNILDLEIHTSEFIQNFYSTSSDYVHFNKKSLLSDSFSKSNNGFSIGLLNKHDDGKRQLLVNMIEILSYNSDVLEKALQIHGKIFSGNSIVNDLSYIHSNLAINLTFSGLYDFAK